jgi:glyoxylase-like metal-dependent hydrolase (beta-lactamase superfamily II)
MTCPIRRSPDVRVHHLNCGTMRPPATPGELVCHVLLVEAPDGLVLVDSGLGLQDVAHPGRRFGPSRFLVRPAFEESETAFRQVERLGLDPRDVRDVVLTHFDADHVGGLADFPRARVHLTVDEARGALHPSTVTERMRYRAVQRDHGPVLVQHRPRDSEAWRGFAATELSDVAPGVVLVGLPGHTRGHAAVAVDTGDGWVLHVGDAFYHRSQVDGSGTAPATLRTMERAIAFDRRRVQENHARLAELWAGDEPDLVIVNAHDPELLRRAQERGR